jgi:hypothetical protein
LRAEGYVMYSNSQDELSASVLWARLVAYAKPDRVFGIVHAAGGNLHHHYPKGRTLSGVPFIAMNVQFESCGPEGGIRPHPGLETQWYLMGDTMLERRRQDSNHLMSLVVVPPTARTPKEAVAGSAAIGSARKGQSRSGFYPKTSNSLETIGGPAETDTHSPDSTANTYASS